MTLLYRYASGYYNEKNKHMLILFTYGRANVRFVKCCNYSYFCLY